MAWYVRDDGGSPVPASSIDSHYDARFCRNPTYTPRYTNTQAMMGRSTTGGSSRPIGHQPPPQPRQALVERRRRSRSRRRGAGAAAGLVLLPARLCCLLAVLLVVLFGAGRRGVEAFAPAPALSTGGPCCRPSVDSRRDARGLLAMKEEGSGAKKPIKRVCATNKCVRTPSWCWVGFWLMMIDHGRPTQKTNCPLLVVVWPGLAVVVRISAHTSVRPCTQSLMPTIGMPSPRTRSARSSKQASPSWERKS